MDGSSIKLAADRRKSTAKVLVLVIVCEHQTALSRFPCKPAAG